MGRLNHYQKNCPPLEFFHFHGKAAPTRWSLNSRLLQTMSLDISDWRDLFRIRSENQIVGMGVCLCSHISKSFFKIRSYVPPFLIFKIRAYVPTVHLTRGGVRNFFFQTFFCNMNMQIDCIIVEE